MIDFFNFCNEMLCVADRRGYFTELNQAWTRTLGWSVDELMSRPYLDFVHPDDVAATIREATSLQSESYETVRFRNRYRCKDGSYKWIAWQVKPKPGTGDLIATARDVTDEQLQFEALQAAELRFHSLADHAPIGIAEADRDGRVSYVNEQLCQIVAARPSDLMDQQWKQFIYDQDRPRMHEIWQDALQAGVNLSAQEFRITRSDGMTRWVSCSVSMLRDSAGSLTGQIISLIDIHQQRTSAQRYRTVFEQSPLGIAVLDSNTGRFLEINPAYAKILGHTREETLALDFQTVTHPDDLQADLDHMEQLRKGDIRQFRMEKRYVRPDGTLASVDLTVAPLWAEGEAPTVHMCIVEDITERKQAEDRLETREAQLAGLLDNTSAIVYLKDAQGRYLLVSRSFETTFHKPSSEIRGKSDFDLFLEPTARQFRTFDQEIWRSRKARVMEEIVEQDDGLHTYRSVKYPVCDKRGRMLALGGISTDITDLTEAYQNLAEKEKLLQNLLEVQEQEKQFICYEFHDGLIQYAVGSVFLLENYRRQFPQDAGSTVIDKVIDGLRKGIADGRRVIRGIRPTVLDDLGLRAAIEDLIDQLSASDMNVAFDFDVGIRRLPKELETTIYRVVQEALNNVRRHSGSNRAKLKIELLDNDLVVEVEDSGCGFNVQSAKRSGFGLLGMTERVRLMGGVCHIMSAKGCGTRVSICLPLTDASGNGSKKSQA